MGDVDDGPQLSQEDEESEDEVEVTIGPIIEMAAAPAPALDPAAVVGSLAEVDSSSLSTPAPAPVMLMHSAYSSTMRSIMVYPLDNYHIGTKEAHPIKDPSVPARFARMRKNYLAQGQRRTAHGVMMVQRGGHPHVLLLKSGPYFKLPGGKLKPGQDVREGLMLKLQRKLAPPSSSTYPSPKWEIDELLSTWWRPNFDTYIVR